MTTLQRSGRASAADRLRRLFWRIALGLTGGLRVHGEPPAGPCVLVANHTSHADTAALLAALPAERSPRVAASAAYWFSRPLRATFCRLFAGAFPLRRTLTQAEDLLRAGHLVVLYPEGTRSRDGQLGVFRTGAVRLADRAGVPLVPVGITGTRELLPVRGRVRRRQITVHFGTPTNDLGTARESVAALSVSVPGAGPVDLRRRVATFAGSWAGLLTVFVWAVAEAIVWPIIPEFALAVLCVAAPRRSLWLGLTAAFGSLCGGVVMYGLAAHGIHPPQLLTTPRMYTFLHNQLAQEGTAGLRHQAFNGIPFKVYGRTAGQTHVGLVPFLLNCLPGRLLRIVTLSVLLGGAGVAIRRWYPLFLCLFVPVFTLGLALVLRRWS